MLWDKGRQVLNAHKWRYLLDNLAQFWPSRVTWVRMAWPLRQGELNWVAYDLDVKAPGATRAINRLV